MARFIERFKGRHTSDGKPQINNDVCNPHNSPLDHDENTKQKDNTPKSKRTAMPGVKQKYKKENLTTAKHGDIYSK